MMQTFSLLIVLHVILTFVCCFLTVAFSRFSTPYFWLHNGCLCQSRMWTVSVLCKLPASARSLHYESLRNSIVVGCDDHCIRRVTADGAKTTILCGSPGKD